MLFRRMKVFSRERRQWFLMLSPFVNVVTIFLILFSTFALTSDSQLPKGKTDGLNFLIACFFPFVLNIGYAASCNVFLLMPIEER
jgi:hypothetical protein